MEPCTLTANAWFVATVFCLVGCKPKSDPDIELAKAKLHHDLKNLEVDVLRKDLETTTRSRNAFYKAELASTEDPLTENELHALVEPQHGTLVKTTLGFDVWLPKVNVSKTQAFVDLLATEGDFKVTRMRCCVGGVLGEPSEPGVQLSIGLVRPKEASRSSQEDTDWLKPGLLEKDEELRTLYSRWMELRQGFAALERENQELHTELKYRSDNARAEATARNRANTIAISLAVFSGEQPLFIGGRVADLDPAPDVKARPRPGLTKAALVDSLRSAYTLTDFKETGDSWSFNLESSEPSAD
jgi:hypothetical protein